MEGRVPEDDLGKAGEPSLVGVVHDVSQPPLEGEALTARVYPGNDIASVIGNDAPGNDGSSVRGRLGMMLMGEFGYSP